MLRIHIKTRQIEKRIVRIVTTLNLILYSIVFGSVVLLNSLRDSHSLTNIGIRSA